MAIAFADTNVIIEYLKGFEVLTMNQDIKILTNGSKR